ncbi:hypothetical protein ACSSS7_000840 [Eimeria intestinalis]
MAGYTQLQEEAPPLPRDVATTTGGFTSSLVGGDTLSQDSTLSYLEDTGSPTNTEEEGPPVERQGAPHSFSPVPSGKPKKANPMLRSAIAGALLLLLVAGGVKAVQTLAEREEEIPLIDDVLDNMFNDLSTKASELIERWTNAPDVVRKAFAIHYLPSLEGMEADYKEGLDLYIRHVEGLKRVRIPTHEEEEKRRGYKRHVKTLTGVLMAAAERLRGLESLHAIYSQHNVEINMLFKPDPSPLPPKEQLMTQTEDLMSFSEFSRMVYPPSQDTQELQQQQGQGQGQERQQEQQQIPGVLAAKVANLLRVQQIMAEEDYAIQEIFQKYFVEDFGMNTISLTKSQALGMQPFGIGYDRMVFNSQAMANYLHYRYHHPGRVMINEQLMKELAANFTVEGMLDVLHTLRENDDGMKLVKERRFAMENSRRGPPISRGHLISLAMFLV